MTQFKLLHAIAMPKVLVADKISPTGVALLKAQPGYEVVEAYGSTPEKILTLVGDVHAILVRSETQITKEVLAAAHRLVCVGRAGVGVDNIDVDAATERGVIVMNTPSGNTIATAELTFTHLLCLARPVPEAVQSMHEGKWDRKTLSGSELFGKTLGVLGLGRIGAEVSKRALAFGMKVLAYDPYLTEARAKALGVTIATLDEVFALSDYITVHMPLIEKGKQGATEGMVDDAAFAKMKKGVKIVNCARGGIVDEAALAAARGDRGAQRLEPFTGLFGIGVVGCGHRAGFYRACRMGRGSRSLAQNCYRLLTSALHGVLSVQSSSMNTEGAST